MGDAATQSAATCVMYVILLAGFVHTYTQECPDTSQPVCTAPQNLQKVLWTDGTAASETKHTSNKRSRQATEGGLCSPQLLIGVGHQ